MARPKRSARKRRLTELCIRKLKPEPSTFLIWDKLQRGLAVRVQPTGRKAWKVIYSRHGRPRWLHLGDADAVRLGDARTLAAEAMLAVAKGGDPAADRKAQRSKGTFEELATRYVNEFAKTHNKSWRQADALVRRHALPHWSKLQATSITRSDIKAMMSRITAPIVANQTLAAVSAVFSWAVKEEIVTVNPCKLVTRNKTQSRERILSESEVPQFWQLFNGAGLVGGTALKVILLTGQRPGEVRHMRFEHIVDGWWQMPGEPVPALGWPGTKNGNGHRVWLPEPVRDLIAELKDDASSGFVFGGERDGPVGTLDGVMRSISKTLNVEKVTPHDLRRTHGSTITALGFGRDAMNRIQNHAAGGIASIYDRHGYAEENKRIMETVAAKIMAAVKGGDDRGNVVAIRR